MKNLLVLALAITFTGCMSFSDRPMRPIRNAILEKNPEITLEKEIAINLGSGMFNLLGTFVDDDINLSEINRLNVAVYKVVGNNPDSRLNQPVFETALREKNSRLYWEQIVRVRDDGENVWVFAGMNLAKNSLDAIAVFAMEEDELVLVNIGGNIHEMMKYALESSHGRRSDTPAG